MIDVPLNERELEFLETHVHFRHARSATDLLLGVLCPMIDPIAEERRVYEAWRENARHSIEIGYQECLEGRTVDGAAAFERVRLRIERRGLP